MDDLGAHYLDDVRLQMRKLKTQADAALAQMPVDDFFRAPDPESNSAALLMKHLSGNMRSRWTRFLETDGEKPDRDRDSEFERESGDTREAALARWEDGWSRLFAALDALGPADLLRTVRIRGEAHSVVQAIDRQMTHYAAHVGQIVYVAKHFAGGRWRSLSIPKGASKRVEVSRRGETYSPSGGGKGAAR
jgi:hypothetical protein